MIDETPTSDVVAPLLAPDDIVHLLRTPAKRDLLWRDVARRIKLGYSTQQIAEAMGVHYATIRRWFGDPRFIIFVRQFDETLFEQIDAEIGSLKGRLEEAAPHAFEELLSIMATAEDPKVRAQVAQDILDRAGHAPVKRSVRATVDFTINKDGAAALRSAFAESLVVDAGVVVPTNGSAQPRQSVESEDGRSD